MQISDHTANTVNLDNGVANLGTSAIKISVLDGDAWVTHGSEDVAIKCGQSIEFPSSTDAKILSSLEYDCPVTFSVQKLDKQVSKMPQMKIVENLRFAILFKAIIR